MDKLKNAMKGGSDSSKEQSSQATQGAQGAQGGQQDDYLDKAFGAAAQKSGHNIDRDTQERITDTGRGMFEKGTGKKVPEKFSQ
ncbi:hypothetical protein ACRALDRAFT_1065415 [Sodiomyces alcalophilus JCM 7366]|uniref:uncharacterized protein n=1 Tax=Sodiomyces alcalophilus JCM 7366 TaxID=591952 RepID=UPI0039B5EAC6